MAEFIRRAGQALAMDILPIGEGDLEWKDLLGKLMSALLMHQG
ncbi:hypothetical protein [Pectinatus cerevisiiphilus]|nr:hypothetical protein [Pectinatus cerevisiiphilus]